MIDCSRRQAAGTDVAEHADTIAGCQREVGVWWGGDGGGSSACSVLDETHHREVLSGAWERKMTNQAARGSAGGRQV